MRLFLTGSTGFVGRNYLEWVLKHQPDVEITCLVRNEQKARAQWPNQPKQLRWLQGDLLEPQTYQKDLQAAERVVHAAALVSLRNGPEFYAQNTDATSRMLSVLADSARLQRLVFVGSISAIDRDPTLPAVGPLTEDYPAHPNTDYGRSKWQAEEAIRASGLPYVVMRPAYIFGAYPRANSSMDRLVQHVIQGQRYTRYPFPGRASAIYAEDLAEMLWITGHHPAALNQDFFISNPEPVRTGQAFADVARALNVPFEPMRRTPLQIQETYRQLLHRQPDNLLLRILFEDYFYCSPEKWYRLTGTQPRYGYAEGLKRTLHWCRQQGLF